LPLTLVRKEITASLGLVYTSGWKKGSGSEIGFLRTDGIEDDWMGHLGRDNGVVGATDR
jgi:hypothetical protein